MAPARGCSLSVPVPNTLKEALEFLDALYTNVGGPKMAVVNELGRQLNNGYENISRTIELVFYNVNQLRLKIIGDPRLRSYGNYNELKESHESDIECVNYVISVLVHLLPQLVTTLKFLEQKVGYFGSNYWGSESFGGTNYRTAIHRWLTKSPPGDDEDQLPGGYVARDLTRNTGNGLHTYLFELVGQRNGFLVKLCERMKRLESLYPPHKVTPQPPSPSPHVSASQGSLELDRSSSQDQQMTHQVPGYLSHEPYTEIPQSPIDGSSSTAAIGGAVGATGLVGGGAAVYFLNIGGIRTLIAG
ncbi:secreted antigen 1 [Babesia caballi]|uniref:Secreted antigen 1 n=1 Tax=Babesia caballi TaxID=5871 RepID=A0AAV4LPB9_BABCB|nr:secreted antigen 1 [Babesia caballi]